MIKITMKEYDKILVDFITNHKGINKIETSAFVDNQYRKVYQCEDGKCLYEVNRICQAQVMAKYTFNMVEYEVPTIIKYMETEIWSDDSSKSIYMYSMIKG